MNSVTDPIKVLSIETTCDETGAAVLEGIASETAAPPRVLSNVVATQIKLHEPFGGVVPEIAARAHLTVLLPTIDEALRRAEVGFGDLGALAVATRPGLVGSLLVGLTAAKTMAMALRRPLVTFDHLEGHLYACQLAHPSEPVYPCVGLVVSGGHTHLYRCESPLRCELLGGTTDDAAGEAFDKVASLLELGFPGGPALERAAQGGNPRAFRLPRSYLKDDRLEFSFSGLKTAVLYLLRDQASIRTDAGWPIDFVGNVAASVQQAIVDVLIAKCRLALHKTGLKRLCVGGGVTANQSFRAALAALAGAESASVFIPPMEWCTDNAALGGIAFAKLAAGQTAALDIDVQAGLVRPGRLTGGSP